MTLRILIYTLFISVLLVACGRHVTRHKSEQNVKASATEKVSDTGKIYSELVTETCQEYGDSLRTTLHFSEDSGSSDSAETAGLLIKGTLVKTESGYKMNMQAVAKPRKKTTKTTLKTSEQKGLSVTRSAVTESSLITSDKEVKPTATSLVSALIYLILLIGLLYLIYRLAKKGLIGK